MTRISESIAEDPAKIRTAEAFVAWHGQHGCRPVSCKTAAADFEVAKQFVPDGVVWSGTWQSLVPHLTAKNNTRAIGAVFKRVEDPNRGGGAVAYQVKIEDADRWMAATGIRVDPKTGEADRGATTGDNVVQFPNKPDAADEFVADLGVAG